MNRKTLVEVEKGLSQLADEVKQQRKFDALKKELDEKIKPILELKPEKGDKGEHGDVGERGLKGEKGDRGEKGEKGDQGLPGEIGPAGPQGERGERGLRGLKGEKGDDGDPGKKGKDGKDGVDGRDGSPDTGADIVQKINSLYISPELQIDASHIKNIPTPTIYYNRKILHLNDLGLGADDSPTFTGLTLSGLTQGSVLFAGAGGVISQDNSNLFYDDTTNQLLLGNTTAATANTIIGADGSVIINEQGSAVNPILRVETDTNDSAFIIDATNERIAFGSNGSGINTNMGIKFGPLISNFSGTNARGVNFQPIISSSATAPGTVGFAGVHRFASAPGTAYGQIGIVTVDTNDGTGTGTSFNCANLHINFYRGDTSANYTGTITNLSLFLAADSTKNGGTITNQYGLRVQNLVDGSTKNAAIRIEQTAGVAIEALGGTWTGNDDGNAEADFRYEGDTATNLMFFDTSADSVEIGTTVQGAIAKFSNTGVIFNEDSNDRDFRVESNNDINALFVDGGTDRIGFFVGAPSFDVGIGGNVARTVSMERHTTADTAGNNLTVQSGGATSGATNKNGGDLILVGAVSTGTGSSNIIFQTAAAGASGTADNNPATRLTITGDGRVYGSALHNNAGAVTGATNQYIASGTYTPTLTNVTNIDASTPRLCSWKRVGNVVTVGGQLDVDPTAAVATELGISLPIASAFTTAFQCGGVASVALVANESAAIDADATNDRARMRWIAVDLTNATRMFTFTYEVL